MRKASLLLLFVVMLTMTACSEGRVKPPAAFDAQLYVDVISYRKDDSDKISYELQLGTTSGALMADEAVDIMLDASSAAGLKTKYEGMLRDSIAYDDGSYGEVARFCFSLGEFDNNVSTQNGKYGFFYITAQYTQNSPVEIGKLFDKVAASAAAYINLNGFEVANGGAVCRYYFAADPKVSAQGAVREDREINALSETVSCLMWDEKSVDLTSLEMKYRDSSVGWYIIPIILGGITVLALWLFVKYGKKRTAERIFRDDEESNGPDVLTGQITLEEWSAHTHNEENDNAEGQ